MKPEAAAQVSVQILGLHSYANLDETLNAFKYIYQTVMGVDTVSVPSDTNIRGTAGPRKIPIVSQADIVSRIQQSK